MFIYLINFVFITISIAIFIAPFFLWYWLYHRDSFNKIPVNTYIENFFSSKQANWLVFVWAASEAVFWFVIPEFLLLLLVFMRIRNKRKLLTYDITGTIFGTIVAIIMKLPESTLSKLPYIQENMVTQTKTWYTELGIMGLLNQPFSGVPYKVFTHLYWQFDFFIIYFIFVAVIVRVFRYFVAYGLFISFYPKLHKKVARNYIPLALLGIFIFSVLLYRTYNIYR